ncbi:hypothetical protein QUF80_22685, partial [Desulfococcaceae bacterium HSG8]|nr:hypothetical protein [Desulfococcaceae bacterium HSG8]
SEINNRFSGKRKKQNPWNVKNVIEKRNREIVKAHQKNKIGSMLPAIFRGYLHIREGGKLYFEEGDLDKKDFESYVGRRGRLEVLVNASLNSLQEEELKGILYRKKGTFEDKYRKAKEVIRLAEKASELARDTDQANVRIPKNEEDAISYLREIAPSKAALQKIESQYIELKEDAYIAEPLQQLQGTINLAFKSLAVQSRKASGFLFDRAGAVFQNYKSTKTNIAGIDSFMRQKEELERYVTLFDSIGDEKRKTQVNTFIRAIDKSIARVRKEIEKQKQREAAISEKNHQEVETAYESFMEIKKMYAQGNLTIKSKRNKAVSLLKKCRDALKSNGQRIKAREVERFLNSTGIEKSEEPEALPQSQNMFYKKAFLIILPVTIILAGLNIYHLVSGHKAEEKEKPSPVNIRKKTDYPGKHRNPVKKEQETGDNGESK